jgi:lysophospholipase L1-like esterase
MPVCGVVVVGPESEDQDFYMATSTTTSPSTDSTSNKLQSTSLSSSFTNTARNTLTRIRTKPPREEPPLRLLVIGDSLAAGVGMSKSGTPALPEAIARGLSQATGGRAVYWTCVGTPGTTSSEIVQEIVHLDDVIHKNNGIGTGLALPTSALIQKLNEWQAESRLRANRRLRRAKRRAQKWLDHRKDPVSVDDDDNVEDVQPESKRKLVVQWCKRKAAEIRRDMQGIKQIVVLNGNDDDDIDDNSDAEDAKMEAEDASQREDAIVHPSGSLVRRKTLDPKVVGEFDIAIVLTGLNDLKETFIPFMMSAQRQEMMEELRQTEGTEGHGGVKEELIRVVHALKSKMNLLIPGDENTRTKRETEAVPKGGIDALQSNEKKEKHGPVVVFPALPFSPSILNQRAPLSWFLSPMIRKMDNNKKILSDMYPDIVVFVDSPSKTFFSQTEAKKGVVWEDFQRERVLLKLTDIAHNVRERVEETMRQHYNAWVLDAEDEEEGHYDIIADSVTHSHASQVQRHPGASMVAVDGVHPNDAGYEIWGRYIASIIAKEWKQ